MSETIDIAAPPPTTDGQQPATPAPAAPAAPADWRAALPEDMRADPALASFKDIAGLAKSFKDTQAFVGADKNTLLKLPKGDAPPEAWNEVWAKLGRPEKPEGYTFEGLDGFPEEALGGFRQVAHEAGLPQAQAAKIAGWYAQFQDQQREALRANAESTLKQEWGAAYDDKLNAARLFMQKMGGPEVGEFLERSGFGNHAAVVKLFAAAAEATAEPGALKGGGSGNPGVLTPEAARAQIEAKATDTEWNKALYDANHPAHTTVLAERNRLYAAAYPG